MAIVVMIVVVVVMMMVTWSRQQVLQLKSRDRRIIHQRIPIINTIFIDHSGDV